MITTNFTIHPLRKANQSAVTIATAKISPAPRAADSSASLEFDDAPVDLYQRLVKNPDNTFLVRVGGTSMIQARIADGDWLVVDTKAEAADGDIVLALMDSGLALKRYYNTNGLVRLVAENPDLPAITLFEGDEAAVWGVVKHVITDL